MTRFLLAAGLLTGAALLAGCAGLPASVNHSWCRDTDHRGKSQWCVSADFPTPWGKP